MSIKRLLLLGGLLFLCAFSAEIFLRLNFGTRPPEMNRAIREGRFDSRSKLEVIRELRSHGIRAYPAVLPRHFWGDGELQGNHRLPLNVTVEGRRIYPIGSISNVTTVFDNENGAHMIYRSDEHGFNNPPGLYSFSSGANLAAVGDSYTQGACVQPGENAVDQLRGSYPGALNFGAAGTGPIVALAAFREYVEPMKPRIVLWIFAESNDFDSDEYDLQPYLTRYLEDKSYRQGLLSLQPEIDRQVSASLDSFLELTRSDENRDRVRFAGTTAMNLLTLGVLRSHLGWYRAGSGVDWERLRAIITLMRDTTRSWGGELYFVYMPYRLRGLKQPEPNAGYQLQPALFHLLDELSIPALNLRETFEAQADLAALFPFGRAGHPNALGYKIMGEAILKFIQNQSSR